MTTASICVACAVARYRPVPGERHPCGDKMRRLDGISSMRLIECQCPDCHPDRAAGGNRQPVEPPVATGEEG